MTKTIAQLNAEIAALQAEANKLYALELKNAVAKVNELIANYALTPSDLKFPNGSAAASKLHSVRGLPASKASSGAAKYSDGRGNSWGGRGPRPAWLRAALEAGASLESFHGTTAAPSTQPAHVEAASTSRAVGKRPAKFRDAQGNSWSGRGSRPRWLQAALRKRGTKIEDFLIDRTGLPAAQSSASIGPASPAATTPLQVKPSRKAKPAQDAKHRNGKAVSASKKRPSATKRGPSVETTRTTAPGRAAAGSPTAKPRPSAKTAAARSGGSGRVRTTAKSSASATAKKPTVKAASAPKVQKSAPSAPAKKVSVKKPSGPASQRSASIDNAKADGVQGLQAATAVPITEVPAAAS